VVASLPYAALLVCFSIEMEIAFVALRTYSSEKVEEIRAAISELEYLARSVRSDF